MTRITGKNDSIEILISDLIFKLGKANQQIHQLSTRIAALEDVLLHEPSTRPVPISQHPRSVKKMHVQ